MSEETFLLASAALVDVFFFIIEESSDEMHQCQAMAVRLWTGIPPQSSVTWAG